MPAKLLSVYVFVPMLSECISEQGTINFELVAEKIKLSQSLSKGLVASLSRDVVAESIKKHQEDYIKNNQNFYPEWDENYAIVCFDGFVDLKKNKLLKNYVTINSIQSLEGFYQYESWAASKFGSKRAGKRRDEPYAPVTPWFSSGSNEYHFFHYACEDNYQVYYAAQTKFMDAIPLQARQDYRGDFKNPNYVDSRPIYNQAVQLLQQSNEDIVNIESTLQADNAEVPDRIIQTLLPYAQDEANRMQCRRNILEQIQSLLTAYGQNHPDYQYINQELQKAASNRTTWEQAEDSICKFYSTKKHCIKILQEIEAKQWNLGLFHVGSKPFGVQKIKNTIQLGLQGEMMWDDVLVRIKDIAKTRIYPHSFINQQHPDTTAFYQSIQTKRINPIELDTLLSDLTQENEARIQVESIIQKMDAIPSKTGFFGIKRAPTGMALMKQEAARGLAQKHCFRDMLFKFALISNNRLNTTQYLTKRTQATQNLYEEIETISLNLK